MYSKNEGNKERLKKMTGLNSAVVVVSSSHRSSSSNHLEM